MRTFLKISCIKEYISFYLAVSRSTVRVEKGRSEEFGGTDRILKATRVKKCEEYAEIDRKEERKERIQGED